MSPDPELNVYLDYIFDQNLLKCYIFMRNFITIIFNSLAKQLRLESTGNKTNGSGIKKQKCMYLDSEPHQNDPKRVIKKHWRENVSGRARIRIKLNGTIRIRVRIGVKGRIRIRINVMRIRNTAKHGEFYVNLTKNLIKFKILLKSTILKY
jgi:hypothetical protein